MYLLLYEIKKQQGLVNRKLEKLMKMYNQHCCDCYEEEQSLMKDLKRQLYILDKRLKELTDMEEQCQHRCECPHPDPEPPILITPAYAYAYTTSESNESGVVRFQAVTPRHDDIELTDDGLKVLRAGLYQINYTVSAVSGGATSTASFRLGVNEEILVRPSIIEITDSQHITSTLLFSLLEGDVVKLIVDLPNGFSYASASLQLLQVE